MKHSHNIGSWFFTQKDRIKNLCRFWHFPHLMTVSIFVCELIMIIPSNKQHNILTMTHQSRLRLMGEFLFPILIRSNNLTCQIFIFLLRGLETLLLDPGFNNILQNVIQLVIVSIAHCCRPNPTPDTCLPPAPASSSHSILSTQPALWWLFRQPM